MYKILYMYKNHFYLTKRIASTHNYMHRHLHMEREKPCIIHSAACSLVAKCNHECHQSGKLSRFKNLNTKRSQKSGGGTPPKQEIVFPVPKQTEFQLQGPGLPTEAPSTHQAQQTADSSSSASAATRHQPGVGTRSLLVSRTGAQR